MSGDVSVTMRRAGVDHAIFFSRCSRTVRGSFDRAC